MSCQKIVNAISFQNQHHCNYQATIAFQIAILTDLFKYRILVSTSNKISTNICAKQIGSGVVVFFALVGVFGLILHCSTSPSSNNDFPCFARSSNRRSDSSDDDFVVVVVIVIIFAIVGIVYAFIAATIAVQRIFQRHYHILAKKELTKVTCLESLIYPHHFT
jgi:hypothetical protein